MGLLRAVAVAVLGHLTQERDALVESLRAANAELTERCEEQGAVIESESRHVADLQKANRDRIAEREVNPEELAQAQLDLAAIQAVAVSRLERLTIAEQKMLVVRERYAKAISWGDSRDQFGALRSILDNL